MAKCAEKGLDYQIFAFFVDGAQVNEWTAAFFLGKYTDSGCEISGSVALLAL